jgi:hypothetical protein
MRCTVMDPWTFTALVRSNLAILQTVGQWLFRLPESSLRVRLQPR